MCIKAFRKVCIAAVVCRFGLREISTSARELQARLLLFKAFLEVKMKIAVVTVLLATCILLSQAAPHHLNVKKMCKHCQVKIIAE